MSTPTTNTSTPQSSEEIRREMRKRFDEVNEAAEKGHQQRREFGDASQALENKRWVNRKAEAANVPEPGENDSLGG